MKIRNALRRVLSGGVAAAALTLTACSGSGNPVAPAAPAAPTAPSMPAPTASATLVARDFSILRSAPLAGRAYYTYEPVLTLAEVGHTSSATISSIVISVPGGESDTGCSDNYPVRIEAGGTWTLPNSYCEPYASGLTLQSSVSMVVSFTDDHGVKGALSVTTTIVTP
jgi:hypothetical protein